MCAVLISYLFVPSTTAEATATVASSTSATTIVQVVATTAPVIPDVMQCIMQHESGGRQFNASGTPLWSKTYDVGVMQIHYTWLPTAEKMGYDIINSKEDNIAFGLWLYKTYGPTLWTTYSYCDGSEYG